jgi:hypothetical protein
MGEDMICAICGYPIISETIWEENYCTACAYEIAWKYPNKIHFTAGNGTTARERTTKGDAMIKLTNVLLTEKYTYIEHEEEIRFNAPHHFLIKRASDNEVLCKIDLQCGPIKEEGVNGCCNEDLLNIVAERLRGFQKSEFNCSENGFALARIEEALMWLRKRTLIRENRNVEGTNVV